MQTLAPEPTPKVAAARPPDGPPPKRVRTQYPLTVDDRAAAGDQNAAQQPREPPRGEASAFLAPPAEALPRPVPKNAHRPTPLLRLTPKATQAIKRRSETALPPPTFPPRPPQVQSAPTTPAPPTQAAQTPWILHIEYMTDAHAADYAMEVLQVPCNTVHVAANPRTAEHSRRSLPYAYYADPSEFHPEELVRQVKTAALRPALCLVWTDLTAAGTPSGPDPQRRHDQLQAIAKAHEQASWPMVSVAYTKLPEEAAIGKQIRALFGPTAAAVHSGDWGWTNETFRFYLRAWTPGGRPSPARRTVENIVNWQLPPHVQIRQLPGGTALLRWQGKKDPVTWQPQNGWRQQAAHVKRTPTRAVDGEHTMLDGARFHALHLRTPEMIAAGPPPVAVDALESHGGRGLGKEWPHRGRHQFPTRCAQAPPTPSSTAWTQGDPGTDSEDSQPSQSMR